MKISRRAALRVMAAAPIAASGGCCAGAYPRLLREFRAPVGPATPFLAPERPARAALSGHRVIDVHAHFFNASDVPVKGFLAECLGHTQLPPVQALFGAAGKIAERLAEAAPTAGEELDDLAALSVAAAAPGNDAVSRARAAEHEAAADRLARVIRGSEFERRYREMHDGQSAAPGGRRSGPLSRDEILAVIEDAERPMPPAQAAPAAAPDANAAAADGVLGFLKYMLSPRWKNVDSYITAFTAGEGAFGVDAVLGALVDFDYWLDCPPLSTHDDQVALHQRLFELHTRVSGGTRDPFFYPVVSYNPWTDIEQDGAGLKRVTEAFTRGNFVAVKVYPPTGFLPAGNAAIPAGQLKKRHPDPVKLDETLTRFFDTCAELRIPVLAHGAPSNGRDSVHDDFGGPTGWQMVLQRYTAASATPIIDIGHFGGARRNWTKTFAALMADQPRAALYGDLGYWEELMCEDRGARACTDPRDQLAAAMRTPIPNTRSRVLDRTMFGTDWLMLSQVRHWAAYPRQMYETIAAIDGITTDDLARIFGGNALECFPLVKQGAKETADGEV